MLDSFLIFFRLVETRKPDGSPLEWVKWSSECREKLSLGDQRPWSGRPNIQMRGVSNQSDPRSFISELTDCRWAKLCRKRGLPLDAPAPEDVCTDLRQNLRRQDETGGVALLTSSLPYSHLRDRTFVARENMAQLGWPFDVKSSMLRRAVPNWPEVAKPNKATQKRPEAEAADEPPKRRQKKQPVLRRATTECLLNKIASNGMCLPDVSLVSYAQLLAMENAEIFPNPPPSLAKLQELFANDLVGNTTLVAIDPEKHTPEIIKQIFGESEREGAESSIDDASE